MPVLRERVRAIGALHVLLWVSDLCSCERIRESLA
jgi:hypothetical protein